MKKAVDFKSSIKKKIESPLAKYNSTGQLFCVLCNCPVKNEMYWTGHVNGKSHREALTNLKSNKRPAAPEPVQKTNVKTATSKDTAHEFLQPPPPKKLYTSDQQSINNKLNSSRNSSDSAAGFDSTSTVKIPSIPVQLDRSKNDVSSSPLPADSLRTDRSVKDQDGSDSDEGENGMEVDEETSDASTETASAGALPPAASQLPEGFFDDPKEDAKARGLEWRDPKEVEWEKFVKEIAGEEIISSNLRTVDDEESTKSREIDQIEEQMAHWQKVIDLERKVEETKKLQKLKESEVKQVDMQDEDDEEIDYEEELDWRSKRH